MSVCETAEGSACYPFLSRIYTENLIFCMFSWVLPPTRRTCRTGQKGEP